MEPSCDEALRFYNNLIEQDEQLNVSFDEVHHIKKLFSLFPSYFEAEKTQQIYDAAQEHFLEIPFKEEDISFNKIWDDLIKKSKATASAWNQVVESYLKKEVITKASGSLQAAFAELNDVVSSAKRKKALADADPLWLEAKKCDKIAEFFKQKAVAANPQDGILFETRWNDATQQMRVVEAAWDQVLQAYLDAQKKSSEEVQQKWNFHIDHALYEKMTATAQPLLLDALKKRKVATAARNQIMIVAPNDKAVLQATISNALEKAREALESWNKVVQIFYSHENSIPQEMKSKWNLLREDAQSWVSRYKLQPLLIEAYRTNAIMNVMEEELRKTASQKKVPQKSIWNSAMTQANQAKIAWENVRKAFQDAAAEIPISKKEEWGVIQQGFEHELTYIKEKMELFRNSQF